MEGAFLRRTAAFTIAFLSPAAASFGQAPGTGAISGVVYDPPSRIVENAQVLGENNATHLSGAVATTSEGVFRLPLLPPDIYTVMVKAPGYAVSISVNLPFAPNGTNLPGWGTDALNRKHNVRAGRYTRLQSQSGEHCALWLYAFRWIGDTGKSALRSGNLNRHADRPGECRCPLAGQRERRGSETSDPDRGLAGRCGGAATAADRGPDRSSGCRAREVGGRKN